MHALKVTVSVFVFALCVDLTDASIEISDSFDIIDGIQRENDVWVPREDVDLWVLEEDVFTSSEDYNNQHDFRMISEIMIKFVIARGCGYLMGFVKNMFYMGGHFKRSAECNWRHMVERSCATHHVPPELCCALMDCGGSYSLVAIGASRDVVAQCNMTSEVTVMHGQGAITAKREDEHSPPLPHEHSSRGMCAPYSSHMQDIFGKRDTPDVSWSDPTNSTTLQTDDLSQILDTHRGSDTDLSASNILHILLNALRLTPHRVVMPTLPPTRSEMRKWCKRFSRSINKRYHFNEVKFVQRSMYWIIDVYKTAHEHHVPTNYTHGLVGCGMSYAMDALNAEQWQSRLYGLVL